MMYQCSIINQLGMKTSIFYVTQHGLKSAPRVWTVDSVELLA